MWSHALDTLLTVCNWSSWAAYEAFVSQVVSEDPTTSGILILSTSSMSPSISPTNQLPKVTPLGCTLPALPRTFFSRLIENVQTGNKQIEIAYKTNTNWPFPGLTKDRAAGRKRLLIHILDSSFNPPTKAHLALARTREANHNDDQANTHANILLLSVSNADKKIAAADATYPQRVEMMVLMADILATSQSDDFGGVAVVLMNEPLFAQKQKILNASLPSIIGGDSGMELDLVWQVGMDTLKRLFNTKYYDGDKERMTRVLADFIQEPSVDTSGGKLLCARRQVGDGDEDPVKIPGTETFLQSGRIEVVDIGGWESTLSSTSIRKGVQVNNDSWRDSCETSIAEYIRREGLYQA